MRLTSADVSLILTLLLSHHREMKGAKGPGPSRERVQTHALIQKFDKLEKTDSAGRKRRR